MDQITEAYRKLALQYHPKKNPGNEEAKAKFIEINQAYNALCDEFRRENYDNWIFGEMVPVRAHSIFDDFFGDRLSLLDDNFRPHFHNRWTRDLDKLMLDEKEEDPAIEGETIKKSSVWSTKNGKETGKTVITKKTVKDGKAKEETTEDYIFPSGERKVTKTINDNGKVETHEYKLKKGEELPKELTN
jgi:DnaJ-class molecular chaperone